MRLFFNCDCVNYCKASLKRCSEYSANIVNEDKVEEYSFWKRAKFGFSGNIYWNIFNPSVKFILSMKIIP